MTHWWVARYGDPCAECAFDWSVSAADARAAIAGAPERYRRLLTGVDGSKRHPELAWPATAYVSHVADNLWIWAERQAAVLAGAAGEVPGYDQDRLAAAKGYEKLSLVGALWSLDRAVRVWTETSVDAEREGVVLVHPAGGRLSARDVAAGNYHDVHHHEWDLRRIAAFTGVHVLLVSGSTRAGSTNTAALRTAQLLAPDGVTTTLYGGLSTLPAFNPDDDHDDVPAAVVALRALIARSDAILFSSPEYAGALPGSFKNLLDWTVGGGEIYGKPVAWITVAAEGRGAEAERSLATVLGYVGAVAIEAACRRIPIPRHAVRADGAVSDERLRSEISSVIDAVRAHLR